VSLESQSLYESSSVSIYDVCCRPEDRARGPEEYSSEHHIVFPRAGVFVKQVAGKEFVADPNHVLFFNQNEPYRVAHPVDGGDECTVFAFRPELLRDVIAFFRPGAADNTGPLFEFTHTLSEQPIFLTQQRVRQRLLAGFNDKLLVEELSLNLLAALTRWAYLRRGIEPPRRRAATAQAHRDQAERTRLLLAERFG